MNQNPNQNTLGPDQLPWGAGYNPDLMLPSPAEQLSSRVEQAVEACDFQRTPELVENMRGFYETNYQLDGLIADSLNNEIPTDQTAKAEKAEGLLTIISESYFSDDEVHDMMTSLTDHCNMPPGYAQATLPALAGIKLARLNDPDNKRLARSELMALSAANQSLFAEASVAVTTISEEDKQKVIDNHTAIETTIKESGLFASNGEPLDLDQSGAPIKKRYEDYLKRNPLANVEKAQKTFWEDTRFAGQLLFHNSPNFDQLWSRGAILPRRMQVAETGGFNTPNAQYIDDRFHSPTPHWSESFDHRNYRGNGSVRGGTIAVPLAEIIKSAPYGRDAHYGTLRIKDAAQSEVIPKVPISDSIVEIGAGVSDSQGKGGIDRTFYASPLDVEADAPLDQAPDGYSIPLKDASIWVQLGDENKRHLEAGIHYGTGQHYPRQFVIEGTAHTDWNESTDVIVAKGKAEEELRKTAIAQLQAQSIAKYGAELVVPLRAGVMNFEVADDGQSLGKHREHFSKVNATQQAAA